MSLIQQIAAKALSFARNGSGKSKKSSNFADLVNLVSKLTLKDLNYDARSVLTFSVQARHCNFSNPTCIYTEIYQDETMNLSIFGLRELSQIPLHDHPSMHGVLKVLYGKLSLTSYTKTNTVNLPFGVNVKSMFKQSLEKWQENTITPILVEQETILTPDDAPIVLDPKYHNFHRITAVDGPAAFFDLLIPPYSPPLRDCHYYTLLEPTDSRVPSSLDKQPLAWIAQLRQPQDFLCDTYRYEGDLVDLVNH